MSIDVNAIKNAKSISQLLEFSIINLDKPSGPTSFTVSHYIKNFLKLRKTSHLGTLDPMVSGVLPIALNRACRLNDYLMHRDKTYVGIMRLHTEVTEEILNAAIQKFLGKIQQLPPVRSRVKRALREREVKIFKIIERDDKDILFETRVQAGTYIRKLCDDIGKEIGGAHMLELRRTNAGIFTESDSHTLYELEKALEECNNGNEELLRAMLTPGEVIGTVLPVILVKPESIKKLYTGSPLFTQFISEDRALEKDERVALFANTTFIGCYRIVNEGQVRAVPEFVLN